MDSLADFDRSLPKLRARLADRTSTAREKADGAIATLVGISEQFQSGWPDPNRGVGVGSYPECRDILDKIVATGLAERREEWRRRLSQWSGQDLVPLAGAFAAAPNEIQTRLEPSQRHPRHPAVRARERPVAHLPARTEVRRRRTVCPGYPDVTGSMPSASRLHGSASLARLTQEPIRSKGHEDEKAAAPVRLSRSAWLASLAR